MGYTGTDYLTQTNRLLMSGRELQFALAGSAAGAKTDELEAAANPRSDADLRFSAREGQAGGVDPDDSLRAILFEVQSANVLIAAGLATEVPKPTTSHLSQALDQIEETQNVATLPVRGAGAAI
jgi:hypothetical protein